MILLASSAAFVGLVHSLAPGHWLPVVMMTKAKRWGIRSAVSGALIAASGHIFLSILVGLIALFVGSQVLLDAEHEIERYASLAIIAFGVIYAIWAWRRHSACHGHGHHGPEYVEDREKRGGRGALYFLFSIGFSPCIAVLPVFIAAAPQGAAAVLVTMVAFAVGVITALVGATLLVSLGVAKLDIPFLEHYGDVLTGAGVALMGLILFLSPHSH